MGHEGPIWSMQSGGSRQGPGGDSIIASVGDDGTLRVWDLDTHRCAAVLLCLHRHSEVATFFISALCLRWDGLACRG